MKRKITVFLLCLLLCGCTAVQDETRAPERKAENQSEVAAAPLVPKLSEIPTTHEPQHTNPTPEATEPQAETEPQTPGELAAPTQPPTPTEKAESTQPSSTLSSTAEPTEPAPIESVPHTEPTETELPTEPSTEPPFDIDVWVDFAREYAVSLGLVLDSAATSCWDNPILASAQSRYLERDLKGVLEDYASAPDISQVWIWSELRPDGRYDIYIGYA